MMATQVSNLRQCRTVRATPARLRPHGVAIRKGLAWGMYPTVDALKAAIARGAFNRAAGAQNQAEVDGMNKDAMLA